MELNKRHGNRAGPAKKGTRLPAQLDGQQPTTTDLVREIPTTFAKLFYYFFRILSRLNGTTGLTLPCDIPCCCCCTRAQANKPALVNSLPTNPERKGGKMVDSPASYSGSSTSASSRRVPTCVLCYPFLLYYRYHIFFLSFISSINSKMHHCLELSPFRCQASGPGPAGRT